MTYKRRFSRWRLLCLTIPEKTQPKYVSKAIGEQGGPCHQPWRTAQLNMYTPRSTSMFPGTTNPESARWRPYRCLQFLLNDPGVVCSLVVILGSTAASTFHRGPESLPTSTDFLLATSSVTIEHEDSLCLGPPMLATWTCWCWRGNWSRRAKCFVTNDVDDAQLSNAHASVTGLSDITTTIWQVIVSELRCPPEFRRDK